MRVVMQTKTSLDDLSVSVKADEKTGLPDNLQILIDAIYAAKHWLVDEIARDNAKSKKEPTDK